tara:strand:- start:1748 stop:2131 length:384 start_codon:yes stop_codon:yes gene_type:complete
MAHPSENLENRLYLISGTNAFLPTPATGATHFRKVVCTVAGTLRVFGGVAEFVDVSGLADDAAAQVYTNPETGVAFTDKAEAVALGDGCYEKHTLFINVVMVAGDVIEGKFYKIQGDSSISCFAYAR